MPATTTQLFVPAGAVRSSQTTSHVCVTRTGPVIPHLSWLRAQS